MGLPIDLGASALALAVAALVAGATGGLHCFAMCGPLACAVTLREGRRGPSFGGYQLGRIASYGGLSLVLGGVGSAVLDRVSLHPPEWIAFVTAGLLVASALDLFRFVPPIPAGARLVRLGANASIAPAAKAGVVGFVTPLLPCGLSYGVLVTALASGSALHGAIVGFGFAIGSAPALGLAQVQSAWLAKLPPTAALVVRRVVPLVAAVVVVARVLAMRSTGSCCE